MTLRERGAVELRRHEWLRNAGYIAILGYDHDAASGRWPRVAAPGVVRVALAGLHAQLHRGRAAALRLVAGRHEARA
jgi:hypothetical protein